MKPVPTVADLARQRLAIPVAKNKSGAATHWGILPEGQALVNRIMHENALEGRAADEERRRHATPPEPPKALREKENQDE